MVQQYTRAVAADARCSKRKNTHGVSLIWRQAEESAQDKAGTRRGGGSKARELWRCQISRRLMTRLQLRERGRCGLLQNCVGRQAAGTKRQSHRSMCRCPVGVFPASCHLSANNSEMKIKCTLPGTHH